MLKEWQQVFFQKWRISGESRILLLYPKFLERITEPDASKARYFNSKFHETENEGEDSNVKVEAIGSLSYYIDSAQKFFTIDEIRVPKDVQETYNITISKSNRFAFVDKNIPSVINSHSGIKGIYIDSHRPVASYKKIASMPTVSTNRTQIFNEYMEFYKKFIGDEARYDNTGMLGFGPIKRTLMSLAVFGSGNPNVTPNPEMKHLFDEYLEILKIILPEELGFKGIRVDVPEVLFITYTGDFTIDALSGGISSLIDITWQIFMFDERNAEFVVIIDEPENHLHPKLQKSLMKNLIKAFPHVQFIVATHNPFIITSVKDSNVYILHYDDYGGTHRVISEKLDQVNRAGSSNDILHDVLGVDTSIPYWAEEEYDKIISDFVKQELSDLSIRTLRELLREIGLERLFPEAITKKNML